MSKIKKNSLNLVIIALVLIIPSSIYLINKTIFNEDAIVLRRIEEQREALKNALIESVKSGEIKIDNETLEKELKSLDKTYDVYYNQIKSGEVVFPDHIKKDMINRVYDESLIKQQKDILKLKAKLESGEIKIEK
ncbi:hypothetical protein UT300018_27460 [Clostridium faecium]|uniref:DUF4363 family protein n=1 Tax=Clostridium faecium TaxID=2762223 RepID=A0ABR8YUT2_9CLOT|nr:MULTISPECIES: hypothetical protein [Clostridium]MBD8047995.1 hypothetical protein [Clostridium faecium]